MANLYRLTTCFGLGHSASRRTTGASPPLPACSDTHTKGATALDYQATGRGADTAQRLKQLQRKPVRITITISYALHESLLKSSDEQGRSLSNLAAYLLETANSNSAIKQEPGTHLLR